MQRMHGPDIVARTMTKTAIEDEHGNSWQYHSRSDRHSKAACWAILFDLLGHSKLLRKHVAQGQVVFGVNHEMGDFKHNRRKKLDLVLCEPITSAGPRRKAKTFESLAENYGIDLSPDEASTLAGLPHLIEGEPGAVRLALEAKACMTAHVKALPRLYDELNSSHLTVHAATDLAIAAGFVMINLATEFISPDRNRHSFDQMSPRVSNHKQPTDCQRVVDKIHQIPRRTSQGDQGFDALAIVVMKCKNDGSPVRLVERPPAPPVGDIFHYEQMILRVGQMYDFRFGRV